MRAAHWSRQAAWCVLAVLVGTAGHAADGAGPQALRFTGKPDAVRAALAKPIEGDFTLEAWVCTDASASLQERIVCLSGSGGSVQICINGGQFCVDNSGGPETTIADARSRNDGLWHQVVLRRSAKATYSLHVDGARVGLCGGTAPSYADLFIGLAPGYPPFEGLVDEVRLYDRALTDTEVAANFRHPGQPVTGRLVGWWKLDGNLKDAVARQDGTLAGRPEWVPGRGRALYDHPRVSAAYYPWSGRISVEIDARMMGTIPPGATWRVQVRKAPGMVVKAAAVSTVPPGLQGQVPLDVAALAPGTYALRVRVMAEGRPLGPAGSATVRVTSRPAWAAKVKVLNNVVLELLKVRSLPAGRRTCVFTNPREGFVFVAAVRGAKPGAADEVSIALGADGTPIIHLSGGRSRDGEAFRYLPAGEHQLTVTVRGTPLPQLVVRAIPEVFFEEWLQNHSYLKGFAPRDFAFMEREGLLACSTTLFSHGVQSPPPPFISELRAQGRHWITSVPLVDADLAEQIRDRVLGVFDVPSPPDEASVDEFMQFTEQRTKGVQLLLADPRLTGRKLHPYVCSPVPSRGGEEGPKLMRALMAAGDSPMWERYLSEQPDEASAWACFDSQVRAEMKQYWQPLRPDVAEHLIMTYGFFSSPAASLNHDPTVDYKVWMDLEMNYLVNDPMFSGLAGFNRWTSGGADEECLRWAARLNRHYLIEGHTELLSPKYGFRYHLTHLKNADFTDGLRNWEVQAAETGSVTGGQQPQLGGLQGRYPATTQGDTFARLRRSSKAPNVISQTIRGLVPGRTYSLKMLSSDLGELRAGKSVERRLATRIQLGNVEILPVNNLQAVFATGWTKAGAFDAAGGNPYWVNYDYRVFRAKGTEARLSISDWASDKGPGGPIGQELACNFIEVQPYLEK
jgi:hypothetical protein